MTEKITLPFYDFIHSAGIKLDQDTLDEDAWEYCALYPMTNELSDEDMIKCETAYIKKMKSTAIEATEDSFNSVGLDVKWKKSDDSVRVSLSRGNEWKDVAKEIAEIVDGYMGIAYDLEKTKYEILKDMSGDPSDKELVESHIHWIKNYHDLYGTRLDTPEQAYYKLLERIDYIDWE